MARPKTKDSKAQSFRISKSISERLDKYSSASHIPKTVIVELALEEYLAKKMQKRYNTKDNKKNLIFLSN